MPRRVDILNPPRFVPISLTSTDRAHEEPPLNRTDPYVQQASAMPAMPEVAAKLLNSFDRDDLSLGELTQLIVRDQALSAKVLRLANSARYSPSREVASLGDAAACLGLRTLRDLTLSASMTGAFPKLPGFDRLAFWKANLSTGVYAQTLARHLGGLCAAFCRLSALSTKGNQQRGGDTCSSSRVRCFCDGTA